MAVPETNPELSRIMGRVSGFLRENLLYARPDLDIAPEERLLERGILDSMGVIELIEFLETEFDVTIAEDDITEHNLGTLASISNFVSSKRDGQSPRAND